MQESFGRKLWRLFYPMITYTVISYFVSYIFIVVCMIICIFNNSIDMLHMTEDMFKQVFDIYENYLNEANAVAFIITIPLLILYMYMDKKRKLKTGVYSQEKRISWYKYIILPALGIAACTGGTFTIILGGWELTGMNNISDKLFMGRPLIEMIAIGILYPVMSELLYRGLLYNRLKEHMHKYMAAILVSFLSAFYSDSLAQGIYAFLISVLCIYVYERYHSIIAPILVSIGASVITVSEKENSILDGLYSSWSSFIAATIILCTIVIILVLAIEKLVNINDNAAEQIN